METDTVESAFDRPRPGASAVRLGACMAVAVALVLLGRTLAPDGASLPTAATTKPTTATRGAVEASPPASLEGPEPTTDAYPFDDRTVPSAEPGQWCVRSAGDELGPVDPSWETARLASGNAVYTLRHPAGWQVAREEGDVYRLSSPDAAMVVYVGFHDSGGVTAAEVVARGADLFAAVLPEVDVERSERTTVAGVAGCRVVGTEVFAGEQMDVEYLWTVVGEDIVGANLYAKSLLDATEKEIGRRVLNSLAAATSNAS